MSDAVSDLERKERATTSEGCSHETSCKSQKKRRSRSEGTEITSDTDSPDGSQDTSFASPKKKSDAESEADTTSDTDSPDSVKRCKRVHFETETSLSRTDSESPVFLKNIPKYTSKWSEEVLPCLRIQVVQQFPDMHDVFLEGCLHFIDDPQKRAEIMPDLFVSKNEDEQTVIGCFKHVLQHIFTLHCDDLSNVELDDLREMESVLTSPHWIDNFAERSPNKQYCRKVLEDLARKLKLFVWQLMHMVRKSQNQGKEITKGMYQELFVLFAKTFNLHILSGSNVEKYTMGIGDDNRFVAVPDAVICHPNTDKDNICAVVEVKKYCQHVGQILCAQPHSLFGEKGNFGIVVQGTKVMISSFKADSFYYQNLKNGFLMEKGATITFSKECNILRKEGRTDCIQTFLHFKKLMEFLSKKSFS
uniref:Uncharacterized protein n=1 Tax=Magallana gigas TaxID=29159 RepID=A0A8W8ILS5_MAGGI